MKVYICGHNYEVVEVEDTFDVDSTHFGQIDYKKEVIYINKNMRAEMKEETIIHEMVHGMLFHIGQDEKSQDEQFVQALANAIYMGFKVG